MQSHDQQPGGSERELAETEGESGADGSPAEHEVDPADNPGPRGNPDVDEERLAQTADDLDRTTSK